MASGVSRYLTAAGPSGGRKRKGETPTGDFGIGSTVGRPSRRVREMVERCCSCTRHSTCSTTGPFSRTCQCRNAGRQCTGCYCWGKCRNKGWIMPSPPSSRGPLRPLAPPLALLLPSLAADIARRDKDVGNRTGRVGALMLLADGSAPCGKSPSRPRVVVGDGIICSLF